MFYCDMGPDGAEIRSAYKSRTVGQYVICRTLSSIILYKAHTIVELKDNGIYLWRKNVHNSGRVLTELTKEEQQSLMLQLLKSKVF